MRIPDVRVFSLTYCGTVDSTPIQRIQQADSCTRQNLAEQQLSMALFSQFRRIA